MTNPDNTIDPEKVRDAFQLSHNDFVQKYRGEVSIQPILHEAAQAWLAAVDGMPEEINHNSDGEDAQFYNCKRMVNNNLLVKFKQLLRVK